MHHDQIGRRLPTFPVRRGSNWSIQFLSLVYAALALIHLTMAVGKRASEREKTLVLLVLGLRD